MSDEQQNEQRKLPVISDYRRATENHPERKANVALHLLHKKEGGKPFLEGFVRLGDKTIGVFGDFTALDNRGDNAHERGDKYPPIRLRAKNEADQESLGQAGAWPQNERNDGKAVNYRTLVVKAGGQTFYPTVFDSIGEARQHIGFAAEPRQKSANAEAGADAPAAEAEAESAVDAGMQPSF